MMVGTMGGFGVKDVIKLNNMKICIAFLLLSGTFLLVVATITQDIFNLVFGLGVGISGQLWILIEKNK